MRNSSTCSYSRQQPQYPSYDFTGIQIGLLVTGRGRGVIAEQLVISRRIIVSKISPDLVVEKLCIHTYFERLVRSGRKCVAGAIVSVVTTPPLIE